MSGMKILDQVEITLIDRKTNEKLILFLNVFDNSLSYKWLTALNQLIKNQYHLEKNYCFLGFPYGDRNIEYLLSQINSSIQSINDANIGYQIDDHFSIENTIYPGNDYHEEHSQCGCLIHEKLNWLHRYFEDLQGQSGRISPYYTKADPTTRWHIRQLNLLCHEYECLVLSMRKTHTAQEWIRPSQLMCWLHAPRFLLTPEDYDLFGIDTINRPLGGVFVGVNKAVGKHHWEVFNDEGRDSRLDELTTTTLASQTEAAGDFDIEWGVNPANRPWQITKLSEFRQWLTDNGFDPEDKTLTIGHPQVGQIDLQRSFNSDKYQDIWNQLNKHLDVYSIKTSESYAEYLYHWSDKDFINQQVKIIQGNQ